MSNLRLSRKLPIVALSGLALTCANIARADTPMTAGLVLEKMAAGERYTYYFGIVQGLAYARFLKDTIANDNRKDQRGMDCIQNWFHDESGQRSLSIELNMKKYPEFSVPVLINAMIKKECGE